MTLELWPAFVAASAMSWLVMPGIGFSRAG